MCDPLVEDCPVEDPSGPAFGGRVQEDGSQVTSQEVLAANLSVVGALITMSAYLGFNQFVIKQTTAYGTVMSDYKTLDASDYWGKANKVSGYGLLAVSSLTTLLKVLELLLPKSSPISALWWSYGLVGLGSVLGFAYAGLMWQAYEKCKTN